MKRLIILFKNLFFVCVCVVKDTHSCLICLIELSCIFKIFKHNFPQGNKKGKEGEEAF